MNGKHNIVDIGADDFLKHFDDLIYALDEPRMGMGAFPQYMVARHAAKISKLSRLAMAEMNYFLDILFLSWPKGGGVVQRQKGRNSTSCLLCTRSYVHSSAEYGRHMPVLWNRSCLVKSCSVTRMSIRLGHFCQALQAGETSLINQIFSNLLTCIFAKSTYC